MRERDRYLSLVALFAVSLSLRPQIVAIGPLLPSIRRGLSMSHSVAGLLATIVVLCMGLFAPASVRVARRFGARHTIALALVLISIFGILRALVPSAIGSLLLTVPIGIGVAIAGSVMPGLVEETWPERPAFTTGVYAIGIGAGAALSAAAAIPLAEIAWGWRGSLVVFSAFTLLVLVVWLLLTATRLPHAWRTHEAPRIPWRSADGWRLVFIFTLTSIAYYGIYAWLPSVYVDRGWSSGMAGDLLTVISVVTLPVSLAVAWAGDRFGSRRNYLTAGGFVLIATGIGLIVMPGGAWLWAVLIGIWVGITFPSVMTLPLDVASGPLQVGAMAAMMLGVGYTVASVAPFAFGAVRDATGSFDAVLWLITGVAGLLVFAARLLPHSSVAARRAQTGPPRADRRAPETVLDPAARQ